MMKTESDGAWIIEDEEDESPHVEYSISVFPSDPNLALLVQQIKNEDIVIPYYQREFVWSIKQSSRLIESFLMGLPVPQIFLYVNEEEQLEVIDGQQRLLTVKYFFEGYFDEENSKGKRKIFKLKGLSKHSEYNEKTFVELSEKDQRKLKNSTLRAINVKQLKPDKGMNSVFHIFERLNTGGTQLKQQEIRNIIYRGNIVSELKKMNENKAWISILRPKNTNNNQKGIEIILRLFSLFKIWHEYENPMVHYLNEFMAKNRSFDSENAGLFKYRFAQATELVSTAIEKPFRPKRILNHAILETVMISVLENDRITTNVLRENYPKLLKDEGFNASIVSRTTDTAAIKRRIEIAKRIIGNG